MWWDMERNKDILSKMILSTPVKSVHVCNRKSVTASAAPEKCWQLFVFGISDWKSS